MILPIILCGGTGSRLWPLSRDLMPKQFLKLDGDTTMLQATVQRLQGLDALPPLVICNEEHRFIAAEQMRQINQLDHNIILEPVGRNTAPAIALAAMTAIKKGQDPLLLVLAADHIISDSQEFRQVVAQASEFVAADNLVTFGIVASGPETGYGYIKRGVEKSGAYSVQQFVEKPDLETAKSYVSSGEYYWNSGMFMFKASVYLAELKKHRPDIYSACEQAMAEVDPDLDFIRVNKEAFLACPDDSIDYAVMEKTTKAVVVPLNAGWSDVGSWSSLWDVTAKDENNNVHKGDVLSVASKDNYVFAETGLVATVGLENIIVVQTKDAVLVAAKDKVQDVKSIVQQLKSAGRTEHRIHREVYRPWGKYDSIDNGSRYQVKRITVKPGEKLSIQMHHHRAEHWIVVSGTANVTVDGKDTLMSENESIYIPLGAIHALENPGKIPLELIEVQSGSYLGEDDIVRFSDRYGRA
ncbi:mannose-1-phosphate guanylyltransferase/mannose-6-phosphate isomerase [Rheinheimera tangshanensis]|uniref:mannose-1-phosphate guanylyltransferase n=1 Tax=Rheinheimera tangshanensis TaxID=400153 RepID=A0A5C8LZG9_9GAMM|nr:mannose-1-phosphate guanylyltransferase/mannose-6-phosphate isomerase [Rheinheimera tangshanensis]TXK80500.1 mannose-1-phosphate guanylyltransferase/mannose-6-phosphate isomerase [Rheinheimera tangshanensis]GGM60806.1 mannose-1-phosphate guanyltransferase [Rheinheimera tangshanensis]